MSDVILSSIFYPLSSILYLLSSIFYPLSSVLDLRTSGLAYVFPLAPVSIYNHRLLHILNRWWIFTKGQLWLKRHRNRGQNPKLTKITLAAGGSNPRAAR